MSHDVTSTLPGAAGLIGTRSLKGVPWQIWVVVLLLAVEGVLGNLPLILYAPIAAVWLGAKCLFIAGLLRRWKWVYVLFLVVAAIHVIVFSMVSAVVASLNLVLLILAASAARTYFPPAECGPQQ